MKHHTEQDFQKWIRKQVAFYAPFLGLELHEIDVKKNNGSEYLCITCNYPYLDPSIKYSMAVYEDWKKGDLQPDRILHELCHIITDPLYVKAIERWSSKNEITDEREKLTDTIAAIVRKLTKGRSHLNT